MPGTGRKVLFSRFQKPGSRALVAGPQPVLGPAKNIWSGRSVEKMAGYVGKNRFISGRSVHERVAGS